MIVDSLKCTCKLEKIHKNMQEITPKMAKNARNLTKKLQLAKYLLFCRSVRISTKNQYTDSTGRTAFSCSVGYPLGSERYMKLPLGLKKRALAAIIF